MYTVNANLLFTTKGNRSMNLLKRKKQLPSNTHNSYFNTKPFQTHKNHIQNTIMSLPFQESPDGWVKYGEFAVGGLQYIGFSDHSQYLLIVSSSGRGIIDVHTQKKIARDPLCEGDWLDEQRLLCQGIGPLEGQLIPITGIGGGGLPIASALGDSLYLAAPLFPCYDVVYQPPGQNCLLTSHSKNCILMYRGYVNYYGFSPDGNIMIVVDEDIHLWIRKNIN